MNPSSLNLSFLTVLLSLFSAVVAAPIPTPEVPGKRDVDTSIACNPTRPDCGLIQRALENLTRLERKRVPILIITRSFPFETQSTGISPIHSIVPKSESCTSTGKIIERPQSQRRDTPPVEERKPPYRGNDRRPSDRPQKEPCGIRHS
ncbi:uncharacterized protein STEHIDRAFT_116692 [Stereum hirsutum FP-91666 SS1]|uniref:Uncharacterized protein n=1 Tax=Stereum hirsutum (strain FP-91666) TaxID=721885 RepID=R7RVP9_STEHR|nr:uncharacterized protein STEHIDRAFT_116692 [Stereum hirsutum FP-91666 SS1]EIM79221.1 hypothetical protein STEHIDRAFT_116692 [Stereum hirsutum FP-91666 SS1]